MSEKKTSNKLTFDPETKKNYAVKQTEENIPGSEELVKKVKYHLTAASKIIPKPEGSQCIGYVVGFIYERKTQDKFDFQSATLVDLENVNTVATDMILKDLTNKVKRAYGREPDAIRQDTPVMNAE